MQLKIEAPIEPVTPEKFVSYLESNGWRKNRQWFAHNNEQLPVAQYHKESDESERLPWEINFPMTAKFADYESNVCYAIQYLAAVESRSEYQIYQDIVAEDKGN
jgi:hypothetical protein